MSRCPFGDHRKGTVGKGQEVDRKYLQDTQGSGGVLYSGVAG